MEDKHTRTVVVIEMIQPNEILGADLLSIRKMEQDLNDQLNSISFHGCVKLTLNEWYALNEQGTWKRVKYKGRNNAADSTVNIIHLDYGCSGVTLERRLKKLPENLKILPPLGRRYIIPRLAPLQSEARITTDKSCPLKVERRRSRKWCPAANSHVNQLLKDCDMEVEVDLLEQEKGNSKSGNHDLLCDIYIRVGRCRVQKSLADILVEMKYAEFKLNGTVNRNLSSQNLMSNGVGGIGKASSPPTKHVAETSPSSTSSTENLRTNGFGNYSSSDVSSEDTYQAGLMQCNDDENAGFMDQLDAEAMKRAVLTISVVPIPSPFLSYDKSPLPPPIKKCLAKRHVKCFLFIQANMFPVILRNMDVVAVAPRNKGKTTGLLMAMLTRLSLLMENPVALKKGHGPIVIIICSSWSKVERCADFARQFLTTYPSQAFRSIRMVKAYGGTRESKTEIHLMEGCELLVITAPYLLRLLKKNNLVELTRVESIAFDDMDVLAEQYLKEIKEIFLFTQRNRERKRNHQVICTASTWTPAISSFSKVCMHETVEIYSLSAVQDACSRLKLPHFTIPWVGNAVKGKLQALTAFLKETSDENDAIVISTQFPRSAGIISRYLKEEYAWKEILCLGDEDHSEKQFQMISSIWASHMQHNSCKKKPVLVLVDSKATRNLTITDATILVHYDLPERADGFYRYYMIRSGMEKLGLGKKNNTRCYYMYNEQEWDEAPISLKESSDKVYETIRYLWKLRANVPDAFKVIMRRRKLTMELSKGISSLCHQLRAFGMCRHPSCDNRHLIVGDIDKPQLPNSGEIHFKVLHARSANHFFVRIMKHRNVDGEFTDQYEDNFLQIQLEMNAFYSKQKNQRTLADSALMSGAIVAVQDTSERLFRRARVLALSKKRQQTRVTVQYMDEGRTEVVHKSRLLELPDDLSHFAPQAVECFACRCLPVDEDTEFTPEAKDFVRELLGDRMFFGKIVLCLGRTIWMNIVAEHVYHRETQVHVVDHNIRSMLLEKKLAIDNPKHVTNLFQLCKGELDVPDPLRKNKFVSRRFSYNGKSIAPAVLGDDTTEALIGGSVKTPLLFYIIRSDVYDELWDLYDEINEHHDYSRKLPSVDIEPGTPVLCLWDKTKDWNRGRILAVNEVVNNEENLKYPTYQVYFIDFGDVATVSWEDMRQLPDEFRKFPAAAIECSLANCQPADGTSWTEETASVLMDFFYIENDRQPLDITVVSRRESQIDPRQFHYVVKVVQQDMELDLTYHLIAEGFALGDVDFAERAFPIEKQDERISPFARQKSLVHLAFDLVKCIEVPRRLQLAKSIYGVITNWEIQQSIITKKRCTIQDRINIIMKLISYTYRIEELYFLYRALVHLLSKDKQIPVFNSENESSASYIVFHCQRLCDRNSCSLSQENCIELFRAFGIVFERILQFSSLDVLMRIPKWISAITGPVMARISPVVSAVFLELACAILVAESKTHAEDIVDCIILIFDIINCLSPEWPACLRLIGNLSVVKLSIIRKLLNADILEKLLQKMEKYVGLSADHCSAAVVNLSVSAFNQLWSRSPQKKRAAFVKAYDCRPLLERLESICQSKLIRELIFDVNLEASRDKKTSSRELTKLITKTKRPSVILKPVIHKGPVEVASGLRQPEVRWLQGRKYIFLAINIAQQHTLKSCPVFMTTSSIHLNCQFQGEALGFDVDLYLPVDPETSLVKITEYEIRVKIKKIVVAQHWPRLVKSVTTPPWILKDLEDLDYAENEDKVGIEITEEAEEASGFTLPSLVKASNDKVTKTINCYREFCRRKMRRAGKPIVGRPPDIDAGDWILANNSDSSKSNLRVDEDDDKNVSKAELDEDEEVPEDYAASDDESSDDDFFNESDSDDDNNIEVEPRSQENPAFEDCSDHFYHW